MKLVNGKSWTFGRRVVGTSRLRGIRRLGCGGAAMLFLTRTDSATRVVAWGAGMTNSGQPPDFGQSIVPFEVTNALAVAGG